TADVTLVVGAGVLVDLDEHDTGGVEVGLDPVGVHQNGGAAHWILPGCRRRMSRYVSQPRQKPNAALRMAASSAAAVAPKASGVIHAANPISPTSANPSPTA